MNNFLAVAKSATDCNSDYELLVSSLQSLDPTEGVRLLKQFMQTYPSFGQGHNDLGVMYLKCGNPTLALAHHEKACRLQPENITFRKNLADFYAVELGWFDDAVDIYLDILKRNPRDTEALISLGRLGSALEGTALLEQPPAQPALQVQPAPRTVAESRNVEHQIYAPVVPRKSFDEMYREARECADSGRLAESRRLLEVLCGLQPGNATVYNDLGVVCHNLGDVAGAQVNYEKASSLDPASEVFASNLADLYFAELGRVDEAIGIYLGLYSKNPRNIEVLVNLGHLCVAVDRMAEAKSFYRAALEIEPWNSNARQSLSAITEQPPQPPISQNRRTAEEIHSEASRLSAADKPHEAHSILEGLVNQYPGYAPGHNDLGVLRYQTGDAQGAGKAYEQAVRLQPVNTNFRKNLADLYFVELGRVDDAIKLYLDLFREQPGDIDTLLALGQICATIGRYEEAKSFYRRVLEIEPWNVAARAAMKDLQ